MSTKPDVGTTLVEKSGDTDLVITRVFNAPRHLVFDAHTNPKHLINWMTGFEGWTMPECDLDLRQGGHWRFVWHREDESDMVMTGMYTDVDAPALYASTEDWGEPFPQALNIVTFVETDGRTAVRTRVIYKSNEVRDQAIQTGMEDGMNVSYARLDDYLQNVS